MRVGGGRLPLSNPRKPVFPVVFQQPVVCEFKFSQSHVRETRVSRSVPTTCCTSAKLAPPVCELKSSQLHVREPSVSRSVPSIAKLVPLVREFFEWSMPQLSEWWKSEVFM